MTWDTLKWVGGGIGAILTGLGLLRWRFALAGRADVAALLATLKEVRADSEALRKEIRGLRQEIGTLRQQNSVQQIEMEGLAKANRECDDKHERLQREFDEFKAKS